MEKFRYLDHTSEAKFQAFGKSQEEAFANAGIALTGLMTKIEEVEPKSSREIKIVSGSLQSLLYDFLDEIIYIADVDNLFIRKFENTKIEEKDGKLTLVTTALGDSISNCVKGGEVKAPTYDEMKIEQQKNKSWMIQAVVDV